MANLVIKNNTGTASSITFDNKSGSDWKIINNNGTFTLNGKSTNWFTLSDTGIAKFAGRVAIKMDPDAGSTENNFAASALSVAGAIAAYNGNIRAIRDNDSDVMLWCENTIGSVALLVHKSKQIAGLLLRRPNDEFMLWYDLQEKKYKQVGTTFINHIYVNGFVTAQADTAVERSFQAINSLGKVSMTVAKNGNRGLYNTLPGENQSRWMIHWSEENQRQQQSSTYFTGTPYISNSTYWPYVWFSSSNTDESPMGRIAYAYRGENSTSYDWGRFLFYEHSYKTGTKTKLDYYERYILPKVTADLTANEDYYILTTKPNTQTYTFSRLRLTATTDAAADADNAVALIIGDREGTHLAIDNNEIIAKTGPTAAGTLSLNVGGGLVQVGGGGLSSSGTITANSSLVVNNSSIGGNIHFTPTRSTDDKPMGTINHYSSGSTSATAYNLGSFYFVHYSYKTGTYNRVEHWDRYRLPAVAADKTTDDTYLILTTKSPVTVAQGGTGKTSWTKNRLVWTNDTDSLTAGNHYADSTHVGICMTSAPETAFGVGGGITAHGSIIADRSASTTADAVVRSLADTTDAWVQARNTNGTISLRISTNMGIWDSVSAKWMIYSVPGETLVRIPGSLSTPQIKLSSTSAAKHIEFSRGGLNYITTPSSGSVNFCLGGADLSADNCQMSVYPGYVKIRTPLALSSDCYGTSRPTSGSYTGQIFFEW